MRFICRTLIVLALALPAAAQQPDEDVTTVVVPVVGTVDGVFNVRWLTDVELVNDLRSETTVSLTLPAAPGEPVIVVTIGAGDRVRFTDVVGQAFGIDSALSPLVVRTIGRRSVTIRATAYGVREGRPLTAQPIAVNYGATYFPQRVLDGLSFSDALRTNVGLANLGTRPAEFTLAVQRLPGRNVAVTRVILPPSTLWHAAVQSLFPMITKGDDFAVVVETASEETYVYASVIENETSRAKFVQPRIR